jgi:hypothetical protein
MSFSHSDYLAMQARCDRSRKTICENLGETKGVSKESDLHNDIIAFCKSKGWIYFHGSMAHRAMRTRGECDFQILADRGRVFFIERKTKTGKLSSEQLGLQMWAEKLGHKIHLCRTMDEFLEIVK